MKTLEVPDLVNTQKYWLDENPALTHFMSSLSVLFPDGERFFMKSMNAYRNQLPEYYVKELNQFCVQEANHGRLHEKLNSLIDPETLPMLEKNAKNLLKIAERILTKKQQLALTIVLEHLTAIMGYQLLVRKDITDRMTSDVKDVWMYHGTEELEHAHVAYDIYTRIGGGYLLRTTMSPPATLILAFVVVCNWVYLMYKDNENGFKGLLRATNILIGVRGFVTGLVPEYLKWFVPKYHPETVQKLKTPL